MNLNVDNKNLVQNPKLLQTLANVNIPYDAELQWIQTNGNAYAKTGYGVNEKIRFEIKGHFNNQHSYENWLLGDWNGKCYLAGTYGNYNRCRVGPDDSAHSADLLASGYDKGIHIWKADDNYCYVDDVVSPGIDWNNIPLTGREIIIGKSWHYNTANTRRIYYCKLWDPFGKLIRNLIPVRLEDRGFLYDKVTNEFLENGGTENFTLGPDVK